MAQELAQVAQEDRLRTASLERVQHRLCPIIRPVAEEGRVRLDASGVYLLVRRVVYPILKTLDERLHRTPGALDPPGAEDADRRTQHRVGRVAGFAGSVCRRQDWISVEKQGCSEADIRQGIAVGVIRLA